MSLAAGSHVVIEKPLAPSLEDARAIVSAARRHGRVAMVAQNYRFRRQSRALRDLVRGGALGRLRGLWIECRRDLRAAWISPRDWRGRMPVVIEFANFTCPVSTGHVGPMDELAQEFAGKVQFLVVYGNEEHPGNGPAFTSSLTPGASRTHTESATDQ